MPHTEYVFTTGTGWTLLPSHAHKLSPLAPAQTLSDALYQQHFMILGQSGEGRCGLGHFQVWARPAQRRSGLPRYALEIDQVDEASIVWIDTLPDLWDFLRLYGQVGFSMGSSLPGEHDDEEDEEDEAGEGQGPRGVVPGMILPFHPRTPGGLN